MKVILETTSHGVFVVEKYKKPVDHYYKKLLWLSTYNIDWRVYL